MGVVRGGVLLIVLAALLGACGSGGTPTPAGTSKAASPVAGTPSAAGGSIRPIDGGGAAPPAGPPATPEPVPAAVTSAFPGLPLDKVQAMNYNPTEKRIILVTYLANSDVAGAREVCQAFLGVALFDPNASISVVANDYTQLASCSKS